MRPAVRALIAALFPALLTCPLAAHAQTASPPGDRDRLWDAGLGLIAGQGPAYPGAAGQVRGVRLLPYANYRGSILRVEDGAVGLRALQTPRTEWGISGSFAFGGGKRGIAARDGMPAIGTLIEVGPLLRVNLGPLDQGAAEARRTRLEVPLRVVLDLDRHLHRAGFSFEPRLAHTWWQDGGNMFSTAAGVVVGDRRLTSRFYQVDPAYATPERPAYQARAGLIATRGSAVFAHAFTPTFRGYLFGAVESVRGSANAASPLVRRAQDGSFGFGFTWGILRSEQPAEQ